MRGLGKSRFVRPPNPLSVTGNSPLGEGLEVHARREGLVSEPVSTTTQTSSFVSQSSSASLSATAVARLIALRASGRLIVSSLNVSASFAQYFVGHGFSFVTAPQGHQGRR